jgi:hypothetical protein
MTCQEVIEAEDNAKGIKKKVKIFVALLFIARGQYHTHKNST